MGPTASVWLVRCLRTSKKLLDQLPAGERAAAVRPRSSRMLRVCLERGEVVLVSWLAGLNLDCQSFWLRLVRGKSFCSGALENADTSSSASKNVHQRHM